MPRSRLNYTMSKAIRNHIRSNLIGYIALFFALSTGSAVALNGSNTVFSDDIVDGQVKSPDLAKLAFTPVKPNPVTDANPCDSGQVGVFCGHDSDSGARGWLNFGGGYAPVAHARDGLGIVHLRGTMKETCPIAVSGNLSFILPSGYRPAATHEFVVAYGQDNSLVGCTGCDERHAVVRVSSNGFVTPLEGQPGAGGPSTAFREGVSLDGIEFKAK
jgi:hypothetical protein